MRSSLFSLALLAGSAAARPHSRAANTTVEEETRSLDELYQAALAEGNVVTLWHGGDEKTSQNALKLAFEKRFPGITLNVTVDVSKYHDGEIDQQLAANNVYVDSVILQTLHDYPRWKEEGALLNYAPAGFNSIYPQFKDADAAYAGLFIIAWGLSWSTNKISEAPLKYTDFLKPEFKDKLILTYPNDDDAVLYQFDLIIQQYGTEYLDALIAQNPRWVRGTATPRNRLILANETQGATFTSGFSMRPTAPLNTSLPTEGTFVSWPQTGAILKDAPHPEGAKLLHNFILSEEWQTASPRWSTRDDIEPPQGFQKIVDQPNTNATGFVEWMQDRANVERLRFWYEDKIGTPQGVSPLEDDL